MNPPLEYLASRGGRLIRDGDKWAVVDSNSLRGPWGVTPEDAVRLRAQAEYADIQADVEISERRLKADRQNALDFRADFGDLLRPEVER